MTQWKREAQQHVPEAYKNSVKPAMMHITASFARPAHHYDRRGKLNRDAPKFYTQTPDADNITKFIGDALKGVAFQDDRFVYDAQARKEWSENESKTTVTIVYEN